MEESYADMGSWVIVGACRAKPGRNGCVAGVGCTGTWISESDTVGLEK